MRRMQVITLMLLMTAAVAAQEFESNATSCIETAELGLWSPWVDYDDTQYRGQWFVADGPLGGSCSSGGRFFVEGNVIESGQPLDLRVLGVGTHFLTARLRPLDSGETIRRVWQVQVTDPGDIDGDGEVTFSDFLTLAREYGENSGRASGDLDYSGQIGFADFMILSRNFGNTSRAATTPPVATPEPASYTLASLALLALLQLRSRRRH